MTAFPRLIPFAVCAVVGCARSHGSPVLRPDSADTAASVAWAPGDTTFDVSGIWIGGADNEPATRVLVAEQQCNYSPAAWILQRNGDTVESFHFPEHHAQGVASRPEPRAIPAIGHISRDTLYLKDGNDRFVLHMDVASGHLRGTRNGQPFWAMREERRYRRDCVPPP